MRTSLLALTCSLICLASTSSVAQVIQLRLDTPSVSQQDVAFGLRTADGGFVLEHHPLGATRAFQRYSALGVPLWRRRIFNPDQGDEYPQIETSDGGFFLGAWWSDPVSVNSDSIISRFYLMRTANDGSLLWTRECMSQLWVGPSDFADPGDLTVAMAQDSGVFTVLSDVEATIVVCWTTTGAVQWVQRLLTGGFPAGFGRFRSVVSDGVGGYLLVFEEIGFSNVNPVVARLDQAGNLIWAKRYDLSNANWDIHTKGCLLAQDGLPVVMGSMSTGQGQEYAYAMKLDTVGAIQWWNGCDLSQSTITLIENMPDGGFRMMGQPGSPSEPKIWLLDSMGVFTDVQWLYNPYTYLGQYGFSHRMYPLHAASGMLAFGGAAIGIDSQFGQWVNYNTLWLFPDDLIGACIVDEVPVTFTNVPVPTGIHVITSLGTAAPLLYTDQDTALYTDVALPVLPVVEECNWILSTPITDSRTGQLSITPNVCQQGVVVSITANATGVLLINDARGRLVYHDRITADARKCFDTSTLTPGFYSVQAVYDNTSAEVVRFVVE